ncbi:MAG: hypothetical protein KAU28_01195 [Phycisphaerae bacterium]|nr:hypothetical protein [Phycisphaerae bacterium]
MLAVGAVSQLAAGAGGVITEGSALVMALAVILYLVRQEQHAKRVAKNGPSQSLCMEHAMAIAALKRDVKHLGKELTRLCDARREKGK